MSDAAAIIDKFGNAEIAFDFSHSCVEELKRRIPAHCREYDPERRVWAIERGPFVPVAIDILRDIYGAQNVYVHDDRVSGHQDATSAPQQDMAYTTLHLLPTAPPELVQAAYRTLSKLAHPDTGGNAAEMVAINNAIEDLRNRGVAS